MIRTFLRLAVAGAAIAWIVDRWLAARRGTAPRPALEMLVVIDAPIERTWEVVADIPRQPEWMLEMKSVRMETPEPTRVGSRGDATVRIFGIAVTDPVTVVEFDPPRRFAIRHDGVFTGGGVITLEPSADGAATTVRWEETLVPPVLPDLGGLVQAPILRAIFQEDLLRLKRLVETGSADADWDLAGNADATAADDQTPGDEAPGNGAPPDDRTPADAG